MIQRTATHTIGFAAPPMEIVQALRIAEKDLAIRSGIALLARLLSAGALTAAVSGLGALAPLVARLWWLGGAPDGPWIDALRWLVFALAFASAGWWLHQFAESTGATITNAQADYGTYIDEWQRAALDAYKSTRGQVETRTYTETDLRVSHPKDFLAAAVATFLSARSGEKSYTVEALKRGLYLGDGGGSVLIGRFTEAEAMAFGKALAEARVIVGRRPKSAGQLAEMDLETFVVALLPKIRQLNGRAVTIDEE